MALLTWSDGYSVKVSRFDGQHKKLVAMINELHDAMLKGQGKAVMDKILEGLVEYTRDHFSAEERLMNQHGYPDCAPHKSEHDSLVSPVLDFQARFRSGGVTITLEIMNFLKNWLTGHILGTDLKHAQFFNDKGVA